MLQQVSPRVNIDVPLACGNAITLASALYTEFPAMYRCSQVISSGGRVRVTTTAPVNTDAVKASIIAYHTELQRLAADRWTEVVRPIAAHRRPRRVSWNSSEVR